MIIPKEEIHPNGQGRIIKLYINMYDKLNHRWSRDIIVKQIHVLE